jgi:flagellar hook-length control protein FliK
MMISATLPSGVFDPEQSGELSQGTSTANPGDDFSALLFLVLATRPVQNIPTQGGFQPAVVGNSPVVFDPSGSLCAPSLFPCPDQSVLVHPEEAIAATPQGASTQGQEQLVPESNDSVSAVAEGTPVGLSLLTNQRQPVLTGLEEAPAGIPEQLSEKLVAAGNVQDPKTTDVLIDNGENRATLGAPGADLAVRQTSIAQASFAKQNLSSSLAHPAIEDASVDTGPGKAIPSPNLDGIGNLATTAPVAKVRLAQDQNSRFSFDDHGGRAFSEASNPGREYSGQFSDTAVTISTLSTPNLESLRARDEKSSVSRPPVIDQLADGIVANLRQQKHEAVIALDPPELGSLKINLTLEDGRVQIRILAETHESRNLIENHLPELKQALQVHRLDLVEARIDGGSWNGTTGDLMYSFQRGPDGRQQGAWHSGDLLQPLDERSDIQKLDAARSSTGRVSMWA